MGIDPHKMLLVDDDPNDIELVQLVIQDFSFIHTIDVLTDGEQAINYLIGNGAREPVRELPRFILMDLKLPKLTGIEVLRVVRQSQTVRNVPIVIMSSSFEESDLMACYNLGVNSYVVKPLEFSGFQEIIRQVGIYWMTTNQPLSFS